MVRGKICGRRRNYFFRPKKRRQRYAQVWITEVRNFLVQASIELYHFRSKNPRPSSKIYLVVSVRISIYHLL
jgi:hypothetical protein